MLLHSLWLAERPNIGDGLKAALLRQFSSPEELYYCRESELAALEMGGMTSEALEALGDKSLDGAEKTLETCHADTGPPQSERTLRGRPDTGHEI